MGKVLDELKGMIDRGEYEDAALAYVDYSFQSKNGLGDAGLSEDLGKFIEALSDKADAPAASVDAMPPEMGADKMSGFMDALSEVRDQMLVNSGRKVAQNEKNIAAGRIPGSDLAVGNLKAVKDLAGALVQTDPMYAKANIAGGLLSTLCSFYEQVPISAEVQEKYGLEAGTTMGAFYADAKGTVRSAHVQANADPEASTYYAKSNAIPPMENSSFLKDTYGLTVSHGTFEMTEQGYELMGDSNAKSMQSLDAYKSSMEWTASAAADKLKTLREMEQKRSNNSHYFNDMIQALADVASLDGSASPKLVEERLNRLKEVSQAYVDKTDGSFFRGRSADGKARRNFAAELVDFAGQQTSVLGGKIDASIDPLMSVDMQADDLRKNRTKIDTALAATLAAKEPEAAAPTATAPAATAPAAEAPKATAPAATQTRERSRSLNLATMMQEQKAADDKADPAKAARNAEREEVLKRRSEIFEKRRENEKKGLGSEGPQFRAPMH